ncbi:MAG: hypothetical protein ABI182_08330, partial [Candidatus Baltobacteraceae bacterium]
MAWSSREVRALLRNLRKPDVLEWLPLTVLLKTRFEAASGHEAVLRLINEAFAGKGKPGVRLRGLLEKYDLDGAVNRDRAASDMGLSIRQFARYRAHAIEIIAQYLSGALGSDKARPNQSPIQITASLLAQHDPGAAHSFYQAIEQTCENPLHLQHSLDTGIELNQALLVDNEDVDDPMSRILRARTLELAGDHIQAKAIADAIRSDIAEGLIAGDLRTAIQRELFKLELQRCLHIGDAPGSASFAGMLRRQPFAPDSIDYINALIDEAEAAILLGALERAEELLGMAEQAAAASRGLLVLARCLLVRAKMEFLRGDYPQAQQLANACLVPLARQPALALEAHAILGRVSLLLNTRWQPTSEVPTGYRFRRVEMDLIESRHLLAANAPAQAEKLAGIALDEAQDHQFAGLESYALATLASIASQRNDSELAQELYVRAWRIFAPLRNAVLGRDLFAVPKRAPGDFGPVLFDELFARAIFDALCEAFPRSVLFAEQRIRKMLQPTIVSLVREAVATGAIRLRTNDLLAIATGLAAARITREMVMEQKRASIKFLITAL